MIPISVLVPVRDASPWLRSSFASLWRQTHREFEVIAVDDGSRDGSGDWLDREARHERRLRVLHTDARGLPAALETARAAATAPVLARHDADDVSHRERFAQQASRLARDSGVGVVGSRVRLFPAHGFGVGMRRWAAWHNLLIEHDEMRREALIDSPLAHGCAMIRREALATVGGWHERGWAEDLDLWLRLFEAGVRFAKLPRALYGWRQHARSSTRTDPRYAGERFLALKREALKRTVLADGRGATLVGTGASLARWRLALGADAIRAYDVRRPGGFAMKRSETPFVLVYVSHAARERWRRHAQGAGMVEMRDFIFAA